MIKKNIGHIKLVRASPNITAINLKYFILHTNITSQFLIVQTIPDWLQLDVVFVSQKQHHDAMKIKSFHCEEKTWSLLRKICYTHVFSLFCYILSFISFINQNHKIAFTFCNFVSHDFIIWLVITFYGLEYFSIYFNFSEARSKFELWRICITLTAFHFWQRKMSLFYHLIHIWKIYFVIFLFCGNFVISLSIFNCHQLYIKALTEKYGNSLQYARKSCQQR